MMLPSAERERKRQNIGTTEVNGTLSIEYALILRYHLYEHSRNWRMLGNSWSPYLGTRFLIPPGHMNDRLRWAYHVAVF